ncbi:hypothetical protein ACFVVM_02230 [Nocardia sp. NPDC058176]
MSSTPSPQRHVVRAVAGYLLGVLIGVTGWLVLPLRQLSCGRRVRIG